MLQRPGYDINPHDHSRPTAERHIVYPSIRGVVPQVKALIVYNASFDSPADDPDPYQGVNGLGEHTENVEAVHDSYSSTGGNRDEATVLRVHLGHVFEGERHVNFSISLTKQQYFVGRRVSITSSTVPRLVPDLSNAVMPIRSPT